MILVDQQHCSAAPALDRSPSSSTAAAAASLIKPSSRRVHFALLPDPGALPDANDNSSSSSSSDESEAISLRKVPSIPKIQPILTPKPAFDTPDCSLLTSTPISCPPNDTASHQSSTSSFSFLCPFLPKQSDLPGNVDSSTPPSPTRPPRTSCKQTKSKHGWCINPCHWMSIGRLHRKNESLPSLHNIPTTQSHSNFLEAKSDCSQTSSATSLPTSLSQPINPSGSVRKGMRMLNGRIYGGRKSRKNQPMNPFASVRDEEPEFVEWGYGGMGSERGCRYAGVIGSDPSGGNKRLTKWERLQGQAGVGNIGDRKTSGPLNDDDDGSGMAWLRKRRERRERKMKEEREDLTNSTPNLAAPGNPGLPLPNVSSPRLEAAQSSVTAVTVPAPLSKRGRPLSRSNTLDGLEASAECSCHTIVAACPRHRPATRSRSSLSESDHGHDSWENGNRVDECCDTDEDDHEECELSHPGRKTVLGASVEKVSRHK